jgi:hypothetical protein
VKESELPEFRKIGDQECQMSGVIDESGSQYEKHFESRISTLRGIKID